mmetsp:Transcript_26229/g.55622  ORF Transcript_26229/g.55622 Transcript_26229/m.55622 type:complete len:281 (+) Transcript_26229:164-1006(+)
MCITRDEPAHLQELDTMRLNESLDLKERKKHEAEYWRQYTRWQDILTRLGTAVVDVGKSDFWASVSAALDSHWSSTPLAKVEQLVCLCLGSIQDHASVNQLALLLLLSEKLGIGHEHCFVFDPCHSTDERCILEHLGFSYMQNNSEGGVHVDRMTLFYMPHGDYQLTDNLVWANRGSLYKVAVLGNRFSWVCDPGNDNGCAQHAVAKTRAPQVQKVLTLIKETHLPDTFTVNIKKHLASLTPKASQIFGDRLGSHLDCTLTTFPPSTEWERAAMPFLCSL